ncbi:acyl-CoA dehydrogenase family protein [Phaeacidiphilus oryzae]|uniref:acyl-CoA dehydrogenase family protein n=1 Tax=Phaeacidiphilus oryzae TaxID=348818 RepID=UPI002244FB73|nr:acyl-CoA dehydrogenase family protein [Phaeacidiphilus oryzae]
MTEEQRALRDGLREVLAARPDWRALEEIGYFGVRLPDPEGLGLGLPEAVLLTAEAGRALVDGPLIGSQLAPGEGPVTAVRLPEARVGGRAEALVPWLAKPGATEPGATAPVTAVPGAREPVTAVPGADGSVPGAGGAQLARAVLVLGPGGGARLLRDPDALPRVPRPSVDPAAGLSAVPVEALRGAGEPYPARTAEGGGPGLFAEAVLLTAAYQLGIAEWAVASAVEYARVREQFGRPIGAFQAVQHLCADLLVRAETARAAVYAAAVSGDPVEIAGAKLLADRAAVDNARGCLQVHGGMGFTWEGGVHRYLKRAWWLRRRFADPVGCAERLAASLT